MQRREFITLLGSATVMWPHAARAQQPERMRRIGMRFGGAESDQEFRQRFDAIRRELQQLGWTEGRNLRIDIRFGGDRGGNDPGRMRKEAQEMLALEPDVILSGGGSPFVGALQQVTRDVPVVFVGVVDPVGAGFVASLARPGGNITGFTWFEYGISAKWLELLKQVDPRVNRVAVLRDAANPAGIGLWAAMQGVAPALGVELSPIGVSQPSEIERDVVTFAGKSNGGLIVTLSGPTIMHRRLISEMAARHRLPAVYPYRFFAADGGLISYGPDNADQYRQAAQYVDRILKGEKPANLPVQGPTKFSLVVSLKAAKALGLAVPSTLLARADEVIE
jgi:putative ABC transport system substrate-binding protein